MTLTREQEKRQYVQFTLTHLQLALEWQMEGMRNSFDTLSSAFKAHRRGGQVMDAIDGALNKLQLPKAAGETPVQLLEKIAEKAGAEGFDIATLNRHLPDIRAIAAEVERQQADSNAAVTIARNHLRAKHGPWAAL